MMPEKENLLNSILNSEIPYCEHGLAIGGTWTQHFVDGTIRTYQRPYLIPVFPLLFWF